MQAKLLLPATTAELSPTQKGWLQLEQTKATEFKALQDGELIVQGFLKGITAVNDLVIVQDKLKQAKSAYEEYKGRRLMFTNMVSDKLITPAMDFEKRNLVLITEANKHELNLRVKAEEVNNVQADYEKEKAELRAHISNEYFRIAAKYREELSSHTNMMYVGALEQKLKQDQIPDYIEEVKKQLKGAKLPEFVKFVRAKVTDDDAKKVFSEVHSYNPKEDLQNALSAVDMKFLMYSNDLANSKAAIKSVQEEQEHIKQATTEAIETEIAVNNLTAHSSTVLVLSGGPKTKRTYVIVEENSQAWAIAVMSAFMKNLLTVQQYIKNKEWSKLTIGQMAAALGKYVTENNGTTFAGLKTQMVKK